MSTDRNQVRVEGDAGLGRVEFGGLLDELREILGAPVDLVMADAIKNPFIVADIEHSKRAVHAP